MVRVDGGPFDLAAMSGSEINELLRRLRHEGNLQIPGDLGIGEYVKQYFAESQFDPRHVRIIIDGFADRDT